MRKFPPVILIVLLIIANGSYNLDATSRLDLHSAYNPDSGKVQVSKTVELALIIASLSPLDRESNNSINRSTAYFQEIKKYFGPFRDHPAVSSLPSSFNLPRLVGNAADYSFTDEGKLQLTDNTGSLWRDEENNRFASMKASIEDFARQTNFIAFYESHAGVYRKIIRATKKILNLESMRRWLENNYDSRPGPVKIFISLLMADFHWTSLYKPELRIWINPVTAEKQTEWSTLRKKQYARGIFTEIGHSYVNPLTDKNINKVKQAFSNKEFWGHTGSARSYKSAALKFNEYMSWAMFLAYAREKYEPEVFLDLKQSMIPFMEKQRKFKQFAAFAAETLDYCKKGRHTGQQTQIHMIEWAAGFQGKKKTGYH